MKYIVRVPHLQSGDSQGQEKLLPPSADNQVQSVPCCFTEHVNGNILQWNHCFEQLDFYSEKHIMQNINRAGQNGSLNGNNARKVSVKT